MHPKTTVNERLRYGQRIKTFFTELTRNPSLLLGVLLIGMVGALWLIASLSDGNDAFTSVGGRTEGPSARHLLGTDDIGRDLFTRVALSGGSGIFTSISTALVACAIGTVAGVTAGYFGGLIDEIIMRIVDAFLAIPGILLVLILRLILGTGNFQLVLAMSIIFAPTVARVMRSSVLVTKSSEFISAAKVSGVPTARIIFRYLIPNSWSVLFVQGSTIASLVVMLEATLSYLGQGVQPPVPAAGRMLFDYQQYMQTSPLLLIAPGLVVFALAAGFNLLADGMQTRLAISK